MSVNLLSMSTFQQGKMGGGALIICYNKRCDYAASDPAVPVLAQYN